MKLVTLISTRNQIGQTAYSGLACRMVSRFLKTAFCLLMPKFRNFAFPHFRNFFSSFSLPKFRISAFPHFRNSAIPQFRLSPRLLLVASCLLIASGCRRDMQNQPKMKPFRGTSFFGDGLSGRQPIEGTIPRGFLHTDTALYTGKKSRSPTATASGATPATANAAANPYPDDVETFPFPITRETVVRGRERYDIFCSVCHGLTGNGDGMIVRRGFRRAASFNDDRLRQAPVGHFFDAITNGWGAMPAYVSQIPVQDRWAIIAYIRALQLSQQNASAPAAAASPRPAPWPTSGGHK